MRGGGGVGGCQMLFGDSLEIPAIWWGQASHLR